MKLLQKTCKKCQQKAAKLIEYDLVFNVPAWYCPVTKNEHEWEKK